MSLKSKQTESADFMFQITGKFNYIGRTRIKRCSQLIQIKREFKIDRYRYIYDHPYVQELFQILDDKDNHGNIRNLLAKVYGIGTMKVQIWQ